MLESVQTPTLNPTLISRTPGPAVSPRSPKARLGLLGCWRRSRSNSPWTHPSWKRPFFWTNGRKQKGHNMPNLSNQIYHRWILGVPKISGCQNSKSTYTPSIGPTIIFTSKMVPKWAKDCLTEASVMIWTAGATNSGHEGTCLCGVLDG